MPIIDGIKFSCTPCIKGHRSANCVHSDRPLVEIKKKGRPVTQCLECRKLRLNKSIHSKCICPIQPEDRPPPILLANGLDANIPLPLRLSPQLTTLKTENLNHLPSKLNLSSASSSTSITTTSTSSISSDLQRTQDTDSAKLLGRKKSLTCKSNKTLEKNAIGGKPHGLDHGHHHSTHSTHTRPYPVIPHVLPSLPRVARPRADSSLSDTPFLTRSNSASSSVNNSSRFNDFYSPPFSATPSTNASGDSPSLPFGNIINNTNDGNGNGNNIEIVLNELELSSSTNNFNSTSATTSNTTNAIASSSQQPTHRYQDTIINWNQLLQQGSVTNLNQLSSTDTGSTTSLNNDFNDTSSSAGYPYGVPSYQLFPLTTQQDVTSNFNSTTNPFQYPLPQTNHSSYQTAFPHPPTPPSSIHYLDDDTISDTEFYLPRSTSSASHYTNNTNNTTNDGSHYESVGGGVVSHPLDREETLEEFLAALERVEENRIQEFANANANTFTGSSGFSNSNSSNGGHGEDMEQDEEIIQDWELVLPSNSSSVPILSTNQNRNPSLIEIKNQKEKEEFLENQNNLLILQQQYHQSLLLASQQSQSQSQSQLQTWREEQPPPDSTASSTSFDDHDHDYDFEETTSSTYSHQLQNQSEEPSFNLFNGIDFSLDPTNSTGISSSSSGNGTGEADNFDINRWRSDLELLSFIEPLDPSLITSSSNSTSSHSGENGFNWSHNGFNSNSSGEELASGGGGDDEDEFEFKIKSELQDNVNWLGGGNGGRRIKDELNQDEILSSGVSDNGDGGAGEKEIKWESSTSNDELDLDLKEQAQEEEEEREEDEDEDDEEEEEDDDDKNSLSFNRTSTIRPGKITRDIDGDDDIKEEDDEQDFDDDEEEEEEEEDEEGRSDGEEDEEREYYQREEEEEEDQQDDEIDVEGEDIEEEPTTPHYNLLSNSTPVATSFSQIKYEDHNDIVEQMNDRINIKQEVDSPKEWGM